MARRPSECVVECDSRCALGPADVGARSLTRKVVRMHSRLAQAATAVAFGMVVLEIAGCAGVRVYSDARMSRETGVKVFAPKPYLLVARTGSKDKPIELSIIYLPDTNDAYYIRQKGGWGSSDLSVKTSNGILTEFGTKSDSKIPESLTAMGSLLTAAAGAYKTIQEGTKIRNEAADRAELDSAATVLDLIADDLAKSTTASDSPATQPQVSAAKQIAAALTAAARTLRDPSRLGEVDATVAALKDRVKGIESLKLENPSAANDRVTTYNSRIDTLKSQLQAVIDKIGPKPPEPTAFELYEIQQNDGKTKLVRVEVGL
jgi:hypothetical protein